MTQTHNSMSQLTHRVISHLKSALTLEIHHKFISHPLTIVFYRDIPYYVLYSTFLVPLHFNKYKLSYITSSEAVLFQLQTWAAMLQNS